jgi:hypothetical protein
MRRWLARLSFSFFVIAAVLAWEAYKAAQGAVQGGPGIRGALYALGAAASFGLGLAGVRERHRPR